MGILDEIIEHKRREVADARELYPVKLLEKSPFFETAAVSLTKYLRRADKVGIIAEIKRRSPSKGVLNTHVSVESLSIGYMQGGASAISVLTDKKYFGGSLEDLKIARRFNFCPIIRKDFIIDEYQLIEAKAAGADAILLIARVLSDAELKALGTAAAKLGLEVLVEIHDPIELRRALDCGAACIGVNNRDLDTLEVDVSLSYDLAEKIPASTVKVAESGITDATTIYELKQRGFDGFLIGESFMRSSKPEAQCARLVGEVKKLLTERDILGG